MIRHECRRLLRAFGYAGEGLSHLWGNERNVRIHLVLTALAIVMAFYLGLSAVEWAVLSLTIGFVFSAEAMNTAIEAAMDLVSPDRHPLAKAAKDTAAAAVLVAAAAAVSVAAFLFVPHLLARLGA
jgi:diacylglycerol kinase